MSETPRTEKPALAPEFYESHFWVSSFPFLEASLVIVPAPQSAPSIPLSLTFSDPDGFVCNRVSVEFPTDSVRFLELEPFLGACKLEGGLKHAHLSVRAPLGVGISCRAHTRDGATMLGKVTEISEQRAGFFPICFASDRSALLCCVNLSDQETNLRGRLFYQRRSPEAVWQIPANGSRVISLETEFGEYLELGSNPQQAYIRVSVKSGRIGVQLLERGEGARDGGGIFSSLS